MVKQIFLTASIAANSTADVTPTLLRSAPYQRVLNVIGVSGAAVNTGRMRVIIDGTEQLTLLNGVTRTAGQPIDFSSDVVEAGILIDSNETLVLNMDNTTAGALTYYVAIAVEDEQ